MIKTIFAVDPGNISGWAWMTVETEPKILRKGVANFKIKKAPVENGALNFIENICYQRWGQEVLGCEDPEIVAIEGQYLDEKKQNSRRNVDSLIKLARKAGRWEEAACAHGLTYEYIQPSVWITAELGKYLRSSQVAVMAKQKCEALYRVSGLSEHEYCAILIGRYVAIREYRKGLQTSMYFTHAQKTPWK